MYMPEDYEMALGTGLIYTAPGDDVNIAPQYRLKPYEQLREQARVIGGERLMAKGNGRQIQPGDDLAAVIASFAPGGAPADWGGLLSQGVANIIPAGVGTALKAGGAAALLAGAYVGSQAIGVQYPWETGPGEGFIAPWNRDIVKDENGRWVTRATRPDLFANGGGGAFAGKSIGGSPVVKTWTAGENGTGWPFSLTQDGKIHTVNKSGILKSWKPKRPITLVRGHTTISQAARAQRYLNSLFNVAAKKIKPSELAKAQGRKAKK